MYEIRSVLSFLKPAAKVFLILIFILILPFYHAWKKLNFFYFKWTYERKTEVMRQFDKHYVDTRNLNSGYMAALFVLHGKMDLTCLMDIFLKKVITAKKSNGQPLAYHLNHTVVSLNGFKFWILDHDFKLNHFVTKAFCSVPGNHRELQRTVTYLLNNHMNESYLGKVFLIPLSSHYNNCKCGEHFALFTPMHHCIKDGIKSLGIIFNVIDDKNVRQQFLSQNLINYTNKNYPLDSYIKSSICKILIPYFLYKTFAKLDSPNNFIRASLSGKRILRFRTHVSVNDVLHSKRYFNVTVNDIVIASVAGVLRHYFFKKLKKLPKRISAALPVNLDKIEVDVEWGNNLSFARIELPLQESNPLDRILDIKHKMDKVKKSLTIWSTYLACKYDVYFNLSSLNKFCTCIISNIRGPPSSFKICGHTVEECIGFAANVQNIGLSFCSFSFNGKFIISISADEAAFATEDEADELIELWETELEELNNLARKE